jgi:ABC-type bacteriocin/lantibiotic exporter with double-glycine peptidase domain
VSAPSNVLSLREALRQFGRLLGIIRPFWGQLFKGLVLGVLVGLLGLIPPYLTKLLLDEVYPTRDFALLHVLVAASVGLSIGAAAVSGLQVYFSLIVSSRLNNRVTLLLFNHLLHQPIRFFEERQVGELMSRFGDTRQALQSISSVLSTLMLQGMFLLVVPPFLFILQPRLALIAGITLPATAILAGAASRALRGQWKRSTEAYADVNAFQVEALTQTRSIKTMALEHWAYQRTAGLVSRAVTLELRASGLGQIVGTGHALLFAMNVGLFSWLGWRMILSGEMSLGDFMAFSAYVGYLYGPVNRLIGLFSEFQHSAVGFHRLFEYLDARPEQDPRAAFVAPAPRGQRLRGRIEFESVSFSYQANTPALSDVTFTVSPGQSVAVVGASGSGKTTLLRLLTRLEGHQNGHIRLDGIPIERIPLVDLRREIAVVWQEYSLFKGTIRDNLTVGLESVDDDTVCAAARTAQIHEFILSLPLGYDTPVSEAGASLSGGQRQRLSIARALLRKPSILILDEATANIDLQSENALLQAVFASLRDTTILFVTHRVATAQFADSICVLKNGRLVDLGSHPVLIQRCDAYRDLWVHAVDRNAEALVGNLSVRDDSGGSIAST